MSAPARPLRVSQYSRLWLLMLCLACFQLGVLAPNLVGALAAGRPFAGAAVQTALWVFVGGFSLMAVIRLLRLPIAPAA
jgi:hypothetical protein